LFRCSVRSRVRTGKPTPNQKTGWGPGKMAEEMSGRKPTFCAPKTVWLLSSGILLKERAEKALWHCRWTKFGGCRAALPHLIIWRLWSGVWRRRKVACAAVFVEKDAAERARLKARAEAGEVDDLAGLVLPKGVSGGAAERRDA